jgi:uncharacterized alkaline shock family protein YloU
MSVVEVPTAGSDGTGVLAPADARGSLSIAARVVEKIVDRSLDDVDHIAPGTHGGVRSVLKLGDSNRNARVRARVDGRTVVIDLSCAVAYPAPVSQTTHRARSVIVARVRELTGLEPRQVDITVDALVRVDAPVRNLQ